MTIDKPTARRAWVKLVNSIKNNYTNYSEFAVHIGRKVYLFRNQEVGPTAIKTGNWEVRMILDGYNVHSKNAPFVNRLIMELKFSLFHEVLNDLINDANLKMACEVQDA